ncbi:MAG: hypothetical protein ACE5HQ_03345 [Gemmatimonadota bacterium]
MRELMSQARQREQSGDLRAAIACYRKALSLQEEAAGLADLSLLNRIGDLYQRCGDPAGAIHAWEKAASHYEQQQLYSNAIALCKKILRNAPGYVEAYRRVGRLLALSGLQAEARRHYMEYATRMERSGSLEATLEALTEYVEISGDETARLAVGERFLRANRASEALEQFRTVWLARARRNADASEIRDRIIAIDPTADPLGAESEVEDGQAADAPQPGASRGSEDGGVRAASEASSGLKGGPAGEAGEAGEAGWPDRGSGARSPAPAHAGSLESASAAADSDPALLASRLEQVLQSLSGEGQLRQALPVVEQLLKLSPHEFGLLLKKLSYSVALGEEASAVEAYLALGVSLEKSLKGFSIRLLTTSSDSGDVTTAVRVERRPAARDGAE